MAENEVKTSDANLESALKKQLSIKHGNNEYVFRIPSIQDRIRISARAAKLRKDADPDGTGMALGYDPTMVVYTETLATFIELLVSTDASWVYSINTVGKPTIDIDKWADDVPVMEVVDQFNNELALFRGPRN